MNSFDAKEIAMSILGLLPDMIELNEKDFTVDFEFSRNALAYKLLC